MKTQLIIETEQLVLRPFTASDASRIQELAGDRDIASTTLNIPHPYEDGMAEEWLATHQERFEKGESAIYAITHRGSAELIGAIGLEIAKDHNRAELGYWIGKPFWNQGYCTEAARSIVEYGFNDLQLRRIVATHLKRNPSSGRVMQKIGMVREGCLREHVVKWGVAEDLEIYGLLATEL
jgi:ribosomal-protein-alanine N-acetyltransferase